MLCIIYLVVYLCSRLGETRSLGCIALGQYSCFSPSSRGCFAIKFKIVFISVWGGYLCNIQ